MIIALAGPEVGARRTSLGAAEGVPTPHCDCCGGLLGEEARKAAHLQGACRDVQKAEGDRGHGFTNKP